MCNVHCAYMNAKWKRSIQYRCSIQFYTLCCVTSMITVAGDQVVQCSSFCFICCYCYYFLFRSVPFRLVYVLLRFCRVFHRQSSCVINSNKQTNVTVLFSTVIIYYTISQLDPECPQFIQYELLYFVCTIELKLFKLNTIYICCDCERMLIR